MSYRQLTQEQRYQIGTLLEIGMNKSEIARKIEVHRSTVWREIRRNGGGQRTYNWCQAVAMARKRHERKRKHRIDCQTWARVESLLGIKLRPEQISERLKLENFPTVSHETIYQHIYQNKREGGMLYTHLARQHRYRKRIHKYYKRGCRDPRRPISERPAIVETRSRLGDWEADTIIGLKQQQAIVSVVERRSRFCVLQKVPVRSAAMVADAACQQLLPLKDKVLTITSDNGSEFAGHLRIALYLGADFRRSRSLFVLAARHQ